MKEARELKITGEEWEEVANRFVPATLIFLQHNKNTLEEAMNILNEFDKKAEEMNVSMGALIVAAVGLLIMAHQDFLEKRRESAI